MLLEAKTEDMKTLALCLNKLVLDGYEEDFKAIENGFLALHKEKVYTPEEVCVVNFFRFEGASDPADNSIIYVIETNDNLKGTLVDAYGPYSDPRVNKVIEKVDGIHKKNAKDDSATNK